MLSTSVSQTSVRLTINKANTSNNLAVGLVFATDCSIKLKNGTILAAEDKLRQDAVVSRGRFSLTKDFLITFKQHCRLVPSKSNDTIIAIV